MIDMEQNSAKLIGLMGKSVVFFFILMECNVTGVMVFNTVNISIFCPYNNLWVLNFHKSVLLQERFHIISM